ncbi:MAG: hypothetical protein HPY66_2439 [Firmicutes bacterium]|nr:hypothetical protein [Bacillota bacterium]MDI6705361.1 hypothetical protein [Bacillota bacterium]
MLKMDIGKRKLLAYAAVLVIVVLGFSRVYSGITGREGDASKLGIPLKTANRTESIFKFVSQRAQKDILDVTLENAGYGKWSKFKKELKVVTAKAQIIPGGEGEFIVAVSLPPQEGMVAVYTRQGDSFAYLGKIGNLLPVTGLSEFSGIPEGRHVLVVDQYQDEMLGAFFNSGYKDYFIWEEGRMKRVLGLTTEYSAYWNQSWEGKKKKAAWLWLRQEPGIAYDEQDGSIMVEYKQSLLRSVTHDTNNIPGEEEFVVRDSRVVSNKYVWSSEWGRYILGEYRDRASGERVALLEDFRNNISNLVKKKEHDLAKIIDARGQVKIVPLDQLE